MRRRRETAAPSQKRCFSSAILPTDDVSCFRDVTFNGRTSTARALAPSEMDGEHVSWPSGSRESSCPSFPGEVGRLRLALKIEL